MSATLTGREPEAFYHELRARSLFGYMRESRAVDHRKGLRPPKAVDRAVDA